MRSVCVQDSGTNFHIMVSEKLVLGSSDYSLDIFKRNIDTEEWAGVTNRCNQGKE